MSKTESRTYSMKKTSELLSFHRLAPHILLHMKAKTMIMYMKAKKMTIVAAMLFMASAAYAGFDYDAATNGIGDWNLLTLGGFTFAKPVSVDLAPINAPNADAQYSIRCQLVYQDKNLPRPRSDYEKELARDTGSLLNDWLQEFIADQYVGAEYSDLFPKYYNCWFTEDLNFRFPAYVAGKIAKIGNAARINIAAVTVTVNAEGEFRAELEEYWRSLHPDEQ